MCMKLRNLEKGEVYHVLSQFWYETLFCKTLHNTSVYPGERHYITIVFILKKFHINPYSGIFYIKYIFTLHF